MAAAIGLIDTAEASHNPCVLSYALLAYGFALRSTDPEGALETQRRGPDIAQETGNRWNESSPWRAACAALRRSTATRWPRSITLLWPSATTTIRATPPRSVSPVTVNVDSQNWTETRPSGAYY